VLIPLQSIHFRKNKKEYLKAEIDKLETNSKIKNIRGSFSDFTEGYQPRINIDRDEKGDLVTGLYSILSKWRKHFFHLLNVYGVNDLRQTDTYSRTTSA
jgi:hypothetical protein